MSRQSLVWIGEEFVFIAEVAVLEFAPKDEDQSSLVAVKIDQV